MRNQWLRISFLAFVLSTSFCTIHAQTLSFPRGDSWQAMTSVGAIENAALNFNIFTINSQNANGTVLQTPSGSVSKLDLKAPGKAKRAYNKGYEFLLRKDLQNAVEQLTAAITIYPSFVAAHNALGTAYLDLSQNEQARGEFAKSVSLDDHLPNSYLNLGIAQLALKDNAAAEESLRKASSIAPLDLQLSTALAYGELMNHDYPAVFDTVRDVHGRKHQNAAVIHYFAAAAYDAQTNFVDAQKEMETLLQEDPNSPSADQYRQILQLIKVDQSVQSAAKSLPTQGPKFEFKYSPDANLKDSGRAQKLLQDLKEKAQIAEAEAASQTPTQAPSEGTSQAPCSDCLTSAAVPATTESRPATAPAGSSGSRFRAVADEVALFFTVTDHGKSVTNLTETDVEVRDDNRPPRTILGFRNESQLPLRLGLVVDTSDSITDRLKFEQASAIKFLHAMLTTPDDLAFLIGVNNSVLVVQDFTSNQEQMAHSINELAPGGGTALWDAVSYAAEKLAKHAESQPVARVLVVVSDGEDNSSTTTLREAIASAQRGEVAIYTVSTRDKLLQGGSELGDHALETLSDLSGGAAFRPGSVSQLNKSLTELQQVIRGRYLVSYKPAAFQRDGRYRTIDIQAKKDGRQYKIYTRKGYYASAAAPAGGEK
jgi:Ca-activated chloride channel homolog